MLFLILCQAVSVISSCVLRYHIWSFVLRSYLFNRLHFMLMHNIRTSMHSMKLFQLSCVIPAHICSSIALPNVDPSRLYLSTHLCYLLDLEKYGCNPKLVIFKLILQISILSISHLYFLIYDKVHSMKQHAIKRMYNKKCAYDYINSYVTVYRNFMTMKSKLVRIFSKFTTQCIKRYVKD